MATQIKMYNNGEDDDDDDDLEALRLAALKTLRPKPLPKPYCPPPVSQVVQHSHRRYSNSNLITIVPVRSEPDPVFKPPPRVIKNPLVRFNSNVVVLKNVQNNTYLKPAEEVKEKTEEEEEEVSTKFSRFEDTESESEEESDTDKKGSQSSDESDADCIALQDDDSLEALMAQMEQEFGEGSENKTEKKKTKNSSKTKNKSNDEKKRETVEDEQNIKGDESKLEDIKTNKVKPQPKNVSPIRVEVKPMTRSPVKSVSPVKLPVKSASPVRYRSPLKLKSPVKSPPIHSVRSKSPQSPVHPSRLKSPVHQKSLRSPPRHKSPLRSPMKQKSPLRFSPARRSRSPLRSYSPVCKYATHRKSPIRRSPSPYAKVRRSRSPLRKRSLSPLIRKERGFLPKSKDRSPKYSPKYYSKSPSPGRSRHSPTPPKKWGPVSPYRRSPSPLRYRSPSHIRRSISPRRTYTRLPSPSYFPLRRRSPSPFKNKITSHRRSVSPSPSLRRSLSPRRRSVSPKRREFTPPRRPLSPKGDILSDKGRMSPRRKLNSPSKIKKYSPIPARRQRSVSPQRRSPPLRRKIHSPPRPKQDRGWSKTERPKSDIDTKASNWSRSPSVSLSPSPPPRDRDIPSDEPRRRHKSPLRVQKVGGDNSYYSKTEKRPISPDSKSGNGDGVDRRRTGRNWDRSGKSWDNRRSERDKRRERMSSRYKKEGLKNEKTSTNDKNDAPVLSNKTNDPVLEARRKKFESNDPVEPASKKIRLRNSSVKEKTIENVEVQTEPEEVVAKSEVTDLDFDLESDILDILGAGHWSSDDDELLLKPNDVNTSRKIIRPPSPKKKNPVKKRITLEEQADKPKRKKSVTASTSTEPRPVCVTDKASSPLTVVQKEQTEEEEHKSSKDESPADKGSKEEIDSDLRAELSRRRAERLSKAGSVHKNLPTRIVQSAFEGVMGKKKVKKAEKKESKSKLKVKKSSPPAEDVPKEKTDGRRVLVLKRTAPVRLPSQTAINVTFSEGDRQSTGSDSDDDKFVSTLKRKLPIHMRLGVPEERSRPHKVRKVKVKHRNQV